jgi:hypothetical protein
VLDVEDQDHWIGDGPTEAVGEENRRDQHRHRRGGRGRNRNRPPQGGFPRDIVTGPVAQQPLEVEGVDEQEPEQGQEPPLSQELAEPEQPSQPGDLAEAAPGEGAAGEEGGHRRRRRRRGGRRHRRRNRGPEGEAAPSADVDAAAAPAQPVKKEEPPPPVVRTGSSDRHLIHSDEPVNPEPPRRPRTYRDLDAIPDDLE